MSPRVALVTGGGSGLGAAISARLAADGALVVVTDIDGSAAEVVAKEVGGEAEPLDVTDSAAFDAVVDAAAERHGRLDVLVNNAGIAPHRPDVRERSMANAMARMTGGELQPLDALVELSDAEWDRMIRVHLYGTFYGTRAALRHMTPQRSGAVVNLASVMAYIPSAGGADYAAAKAAIVSLTKSAGAEVAHLGVRVNAVAPGFIDTPLLSFVDDAAKAMIATRQTPNRLGRPEEVANAVAWLASDEASFCFGETLGLTAGFPA